MICRTLCVLLLGLIFAVNFGSEAYVVGLCGATVEAGCAAYCTGIFSGPSVTPPLPPSMPYYPPYRG
jgi:hypothetical protein